jgi:CubicO group peptidase (beta-lactamase class C family)
VVTQRDAMDLVSRMKTLDFDPREGFNYSNTGYMLAGLIVERVSGKSLGDFARDNIFVPLGMNNTSIVKTHGLIVPNRAYGYWTTGVGQPFELGMPNLDVTGPTNLITTVEDLARWDRNFDDKTVGGDAVLLQMQTPGALSNGKLAELGPRVHYGLGLQLTKYHDLNVVEHDGRDAGYRSHLIRFPDHRFAVACLCNLALPDDNLPRKLVREVADIYLAEFLPAPPGHGPAVAVGAAHPTMDAPADLVEYTGRYYSDEIDTAYNVELRESSLVITRPRYPATWLTRAPESDDEFTMMTKFSRPLPTGTVRFTRDVTQRVDGLRISGSHRIYNFPLTKQH